MAMSKQLAGLALGLVAMCTAAHAAPADAETIDTSATNLIVVLREAAGENKQDEALQPYGRVTAELPDGKRIMFAPSWYYYLGDMIIRLVFDGGQSLQSASPGDLERLGLTAEQALDRAVVNLRRMYGAPQAAPWDGGLMQVQGQATDLASSYFLDRDFWASQAKSHPDGLIAAVPQRGGLVFAAADDADAIDALRFSAAALYAGGGGRHISSALYLFKDGRWSIFQAPQGQ